VIVLSNLSEDEKRKKMEWYAAGWFDAIGREWDEFENDEERQLATMDYLSDISGLTDFVQNASDADFYAAFGDSGFDGGCSPEDSSSGYEVKPPEQEYSYDPSADPFGSYLGDSMDVQLAMPGIHTGDSAGPDWGDMFGPDWGDMFGPDWGDMFGPDLGDMDGPDLGDMGGS
jgi:hypothetical protein